MRGGVGGGGRGWEPKAGDPRMGSHLHDESRTSLIARMSLRGGIWENN